MPDQLSLAAIEQQFADALLRPDQSAKLLFKSPSEITKERLAIYRGNVTAIWTQALQNTYPVLYQLVGTEFFAQMAKAYGVRHPSTSGDLNEFGSQLANFLAEDASNIVADYPYFADIADLEWQVHRAHYAANEATLNLAEVLEKTGAQFGETRLRMHPACRFMESKWACAAIWQAHQKNTDIAYPERIDIKNYYLITRQLWAVEVHPLDIGSYLGLIALSKGETVGHALEHAMEYDPDFQIADQLQRWFSLGIFIGLEPPSGEDSV